MLISGIQPCTLLDFPKKIACIVFTPGCNFRCGYCHNPEFVLPEQIKCIKNNFIDENTFFNFLNKRKGLLDGVVISGGEPTLQGDLIPFMEKIAELGFSIKLDTNGNKPEIIKTILEKNLAQYLAMDIKTSYATYQALVGKLANNNRIQESISLILNSGIPYEFRSTIIKEIHTKKILEHMAYMIRGAARFALQSFRPAHTLDPLFQKFHPYTEAEMLNIKKIFEPYVDYVMIR
jgi:pyruvate formate lyase activating enzyme